MGGGYSKQEGYWVEEGIPIAVIPFFFMALVIICPLFAACIYSCTCSCCKRKQPTDPNSESPPAINEYVPLESSMSYQHTEPNSAPPQHEQHNGSGQKQKDDKNASYCRYYYRINRAIVTTVFPQTAKEKVIRKTDVEGKFQEWEKAVLFAGREEPRENEGRSRCYVYFYFIMAFCITIAWATTLFWDNFVYRKTFTCNDINVDRGNYRCFDRKGTGRAVDCNEEKENEDLEVVCYLSTFSFVSAIGIAYAFSQAVIVSVGVLLHIFVWVAEQKSGCWVVVIQLCIVLLLGGFLLVYAILGGLDIIPSSGNYIYYTLTGRWAMMALAIVSVVCIVALSPWKCITGHPNERPSKYSFENFDLAVAVDENDWPGKLEKLEMPPEAELRAHTF